MQELIAQVPSTVRILRISFRSHVEGESDESGVYKPSTSSRRIRKKQLGLDPVVDVVSLSW